MRVLILSYFLSLLAVTNVAAQQTCLDYILNDVPDARYVVHDDATVTDTLTGLMWARCTVGRSGNNCMTGEDAKFDWQAALQAADDADWANYRDWRIPNVNEYRSLVNYSCRSPSINLTVFPNVQSRNNFYWTAEIDTLGGRDDIALLFDFLDGIQNANFRTGQAKVMLVRDVPEASP
ncbi:hypothetical protein GCM10008090_10900 [Arenicella chitinivorans]|uniref:Lcl C-terminal domain-containing protein n=1 Tax=Arenicella chitinivorans TaxID=1329800 RepID=A0A918RLA2_9GAMM|nr:DUF1566 domain-containing protein [Arenicella chitinivorans]GHA03592.1 hypothetical protein GCM10008090_10900 [Arenicella chitinivorans]